MAASASPVRPIDRSSVEETDLSKEVAVLSNGVKMPMLGLGTWQLKDDDCVTAVTESLRLGYRHIDTAVRPRSCGECVVFDGFSTVCVGFGLRSARASRRS